MAALLLAVFVVEQVRGWDDARLLREQVDAAGPWGAAFFVAGYTLVRLLPARKALLTEHRASCCSGGGSGPSCLGSPRSLAVLLAQFALGTILGQRLLGHDDGDGPVPVSDAEEA